MSDPQPVALPAGEPTVERELLGRIMLGGKSGPIAPPAIAPSRFVKKKHQLIWAAILDNHRKGAPHDYASITAALKARGDLADAGGPAYVAGLNAEAGTAESIEHYVSLMRTAAARRAFDTAAKQLANLAADPERPEASLATRYHSIVRRTDALCDIASRNGHTRDFRAFSLHDIITQPVEPIPWIYDSWLAQGDVMVMAGESGLGKSMLALGLMISLSLGMPLGGALPNRKGRARVLYLDEENNPRLVRHRLRKMIDGLDLGTMHLDPSVTAAEYAMENGVNVDDHESVERLERKVADFGPTWIIFDSLVRLHRSEENSNAAMSRVLGTLKGIARRGGAGSTIIHHLAKPSKQRPEADIAARIRGAGDIRAVADTIWGVERTQTGALQITHIKSRWGQEASPLSLTIEDVNFGNGIRLHIIEPESDGLGLVVEQLQRAGYFGRDRPSLVGLLEASGYAAPQRTVSRILAKLKTDGTVKSANRGRVTHWWLGDYAPDDAM